MLNEAAQLKVTLELFLPHERLVPFQILLLKLLGAFPLFRLAFVSFDNSQSRFMVVLFLN